MRVSACASIEADFPPGSEFEHPEGCYFARRLSRGRGSGWEFRRLPEAPHMQFVSVQSLVFACQAS
jgi:hypothetical protein